MRDWIVIELKEMGDTRLYTPFPLSFDDATKLRDQLIFKDEYMNLLKVRWIIVKEIDYKNVLSKML